MRHTSYLRTFITIRYATSCSMLYAIYIRGCRESIHVLIGWFRTDDMFEKLGIDVDLLFGFRDWSRHGTLWMRVFDTQNGSSSFGVKA